MARISGVPELEPVNLPYESPSEASRGAEAVGALADSTLQGVSEGFNFLLFKKRAQQHVDSLAAQNEMAQVYAGVQNQLSKTQNSRDVEGVIQQGNQALNEVSSRWAKSPAAIQIQQSADGLRPDLSRIGTVRQVDLMGKEFKINIDHQAEVLAGNYAEDRAAGGTGGMAVGAFANAVHGGVESGLIGDAEGEAYLGAFRQKGQELQIRNAITNANPDVNQKIYDDISQHREMFPDVTQEQLDTYKGQALAASEAHIKHQEWAEGEMARRTQLRPKIQQYTNPGTGYFDEAGALKDNAERLAKGEITTTQSGVLAQGFADQAAQLNVGYKQQAEKTKNDIVELFHQRKYGEASKELEQHKLDLQFGPDYEALTKYGDSMKREDRAEYRAGREFERWQEQDNSDRTFSDLLKNISQGQVYTDAQIMAMTNGNKAVGPGQMNWQGANEAIKAMHTYEQDPQFQAAVKMLNDGFPDAEATRKQQLAQTHQSAAGKVAGQAEINARIEDRKVLTFKAWQAHINQNPNEDKIAAMKAVMGPQIQQQISDQIDSVFGTREQTSPGILGFLRSTPTPRTSTAPIIQRSPSTGKYRYSTDGGKTWQPGEPSQ